MGPEPSVFLPIHVMYVPIYPPNKDNASPTQDAREAPREAPMASTPFVFSSPEGYALCRRIVATHFDYAPHDVQVEGVCKFSVMGSMYLLFCTGMGKTSFLSMYMVIVLAILAEPSLCPAAAKNS